MERFKKLIHIAVSIVIIVLIFILIGLYYVNRISTQNETREKIEKISESQRLLSQQILKNVLLITDGNNYNDSLALASRKLTLSLFKKQKELLERLINTDDPEISPNNQSLKALFKEAKPVRDSLLVVGSIVKPEQYSQYLRRLNAVETKYSTLMAKITSVARAKQETLQHRIYFITIGILALLILALIILALIVVRPLFNAGIKDYQAMLDAKNEAEAQEAIIRTAQANLSSLINNTHDLMWSIDKHYHLITFNYAFEKIVNRISGKQIQIGSNILSLPLSAEKIELYKQMHARALSGEAFTEVDYYDSPVRFWAEISFYPIRNGEEIIGTACCSRNITKRKLDEAERVKVSNDLTLRNHELEQFAYIVSHNLRAPVANISGIIALIQAIDLTEQEKSEMMDSLAGTTLALDNVITDLNDILEVKNLVNKKKELLSFSRLLAEIKLSIGLLIEKEAAEILSDFSEVDTIETIKSYFYSILFNLISNSIKYRQPDVKPVIQIRSCKVENGVRLIFKDNGMGIDLETCGEQVFGLYKRFHSHVDGKGMGLYMVKTQVEALGGEITIASGINQGTEFIIDIYEDVTYEINLQPG